MIPVYMIDSGFSVVGENIKIVHKNNGYKSSESALHVLPVTVYEFDTIAVLTDNDDVIRNIKTGDTFAINCEVELQDENVRVNIEKFLVAKTVHMEDMFVVITFEPVVAEIVGDFYD